MKKTFKKFQNMMAAAAFAEEDDPGTARNFLGEGKDTHEATDMKQKSPGPRFKGIKRRIAAFAEKHEKLAQAITFAEAGELEYASTLATEACRTKSKILVISSSGCFPESLIDHAANMAERLSYDVVALSVMPRSGGRGSNLDNQRGERYSEASKSADQFRNKLIPRNIGFQHLIKSGDFDGVISTTYREIPRVAYALMESGSMIKDIKDMKTLRDIPIFCVSPLNP
ncbi:MAG: hypothetical protein AB1711_09010 [Thermodesulfobacteriota bacterium]